VQEIEVSVLVVGAGPIGLMAGHMFEQRGIKSLITERYQRRLDAPKAHALNSRTLEICHAAGLPMDAIHAKATRSDEGAFVRFMTSVTGEELGTIPYERQDDAVRALTPWPLINIAQPDFESVAEAGLKDAANVELRRGLEWLSYDETADAVISRLHDHETGEDITVRSNYLIAADGAGSRVREAAGIKLETFGFTEADLGVFDVVPIEAPNLDDGDKKEIEQITFTLHTTQAEIIREAIAAAKLNEKLDSSLNENGNANAITQICRMYFDGQL